MDPAPGRVGVRLIFAAASDWVAEWVLVDLQQRWPACPFSSLSYDKSFWDLSGEPTVTCFGSEEQVWRPSLVAAVAGSVASPVVVAALGCVTS